MSLLPASRRTIQGDLKAPAANYEWVDEETDLTRLGDIHNWLWMVGRPTPPRPLHQQRFLNRQIVITERLDLHLVWATDRIFMKPLPRFLLDRRFWAAAFLRSETLPVLNQDMPVCSCASRRGRALGFLFSYAALIAHESDFHIAKEAYLIPEEVQWSAWRMAVHELLGTSLIYSRIDPRFHYGELRLSRLNKIYFFWKTPLRGYVSRWNQYGSFLHDNFALLASSTVYIAVVLTAMQVGLATDALKDNASFQLASYGFTVFSIVGPLAAAAVANSVACYFFISNWVAARGYSKERLERIKHR